MLRILKKLYLFAIIISIIITGCGVNTKKYSSIQLTKDGTQENPYQHPKFSPDGKYISYIRNGSIYISDMKGKAFKKIGNLNIATTYNSVTWSVDSKYIAFLARDRIEGIKTSSISVINIEDYSIERLFQSDWLTSPIWMYSETGQYIAAFDRKNYKYESKILPINSEYSHLLNNKEKNRIVVSLTPDGDKYIDENGEIRDEIKLSLVTAKISYNKNNIVFKDYNQICFWDIEKKIKSEYKHPFDEKLSCSNPTWSFDDTKIIFCLEEDNHYSIENYDIAIFDINSKKFKQITNTSDKLEYSPTLSPNNKMILYYEMNDGNIYLIKL
ncbi:MAG: hypothetical protein JXR69_08010 [Candidatus Delongbacteria bacterium]|nr:hypothetical protein [Candidatus Delongbacteria bacterium]